MGDRADLATDPRGAVFTVLKTVQAGMLGLTAGGEGFQPMTHFPDEATGLIWFIAASDIDLVQSLGMGEDADYVVISENHRNHISLRGKLYHVHDEAKLDALWSPSVAALFPSGRDDPGIALLRFDPEVADIWASAPALSETRHADPADRPATGRKTTVTFPAVA